MAKTEKYHLFYYNDAFTKLLVFALGKKRVCFYRNNEKLLVFGMVVYDLNVTVSRDPTIDKYFAQLFESTQNQTEPREKPETVFDSEVLKRTTDRAGYIREKCLNESFPTKTVYHKSFDEHGPTAIVPTYNLLVSVPEKAGSEFWFQLAEYLNFPMNAWPKLTKNKKTYQRLHLLPMMAEMTGVPEAIQQYGQDFQKDRTINFRYLFLKVIRIRRRYM